MKNYSPVIGLEIHVELSTKSKMFCRCSADYFGKEPNTHTCPVCLGLPGAVPMINKAAIEACMKIGLALGCTITENSLFERKNYFYPDLSKGYQISQYRWPLCVGGQLGDIRVNRVHQEEDTGKLMHQGTDTVIDFNRSGVPLVEIVSEPDFTTTAQVRDYAKKLQQLFRYLGVSNADMERGDMRLEANVSVRPEGQTELPDYRVELKNINSFKFMSDAIEYEIKRQIEFLEAGKKLVQETRGWDQTKKETYSQRSKEEAHDYRYFPEPDLAPLKVLDWVNNVASEIPELPWVKAERFVKDYELSTIDAQVLTEDKNTADRFEEIVKQGQEEDLTAKQLANEIVNKKLDLMELDPTQLISDIKARKASMVDDEGQIEVWVKEVINENPGLVEQYKAGKLPVLQALIGQVMRKSIANAQGKAESGKVKEILEKNLG